MLRGLNQMLQDIAVMAAVVLLAALVCCVLWGDFQTGANFISACVR